MSVEARLRGLERQSGTAVFVVQVQGLDDPDVYHGNGRAYTAAELSKLEASGATVQVLEIVRRAPDETLGGCLHAMHTQKGFEGDAT
jgi:hypothetical protein